MAEVPANLNSKRSGFEQIGIGIIREIGYIGMTREVAMRHYGGQARKLARAGVSLAGRTAEPVQTAATSLEFIGLLVANSASSLIRNATSRESRTTESEKLPPPPASYSVPPGRKERNERRRQRINKRFQDLGLNPDRAFADRRRTQGILKRLPHNT